MNILTTVLPVSSSVALAIPIIMILLLLSLNLSVIIQLIIILKKKVIIDYSKFPFTLVALFLADVIFVLFSIILASNMLFPSSGGLFVAGSALTETFLFVAFVIFSIFYVPTRIVLSSLVVRRVSQGVRKGIVHALLVDSAIILLITTIFLGYVSRLNITAYQNKQEVETQNTTTDMNRYDSINALLADFEKGFPDFKQIFPLIDPFWYSSGNTAEVNEEIITAQNDTPFYRFNNPYEENNYDMFDPGDGNDYHIVNEKIESKLIYVDGGALEENNPYFKTINGPVLLQANGEKINVDQRVIIRVFAVAATTYKGENGNIGKKYLKNVFDLVLDHNSKGWLIEAIKEPSGGYYLKYNYKKINDLNIIYSNEVASGYVGLEYQEITWDENYKEK